MNKNITQMRYIFVYILLYSIPYTIQYARESFLSMALPESGI